MIFIINTLVLIVTITCYNPCPGQGWGDGTITADGTRITDHNAKWCAASHNIFNAGASFGDTVVWNNEKYILKDKMNKRWTNRIDIMQSKDKPIFKHENQKIKIMKATKGEKSTKEKNQEIEEQQTTGQVEQTEQDKALQMLAGFVTSPVAALQLSSLIHLQSSGGMASMNARESSLFEAGYGLALAQISTILKPFIVVENENQ